MILLMDTSTGTCKLTLIDADEVLLVDEWQADRTLADGLLARLENALKQVGSEWNGLTAIGVFMGPGSFTGLRIGMSIANTLSDSLNIPIVGAKGEQWQIDARRRLEHGENDELVLPFYGQAPNITKPRK